MEVVEDFQEGGIRIYSLGVGPEGSVDMETLETLSNETGGRAYQVGDNNPGEIESRMVEISTEVRDGLVTTVPFLMPEPEPSSDSSQFDQLIKQAAATGKHPHLKDLMKVLSVKKIEELLKPDKRLRGKVVAIPADIEKESHLASFSLVHPKAEDLWLYLVDPKGDIVDMMAPSVRHVISPAPHEFALVQKPLPGRWWILAVRGQPGSKTFPFYAIAGSRNMHVTVLGGATAHVLENQPVRLWAVVRWDELLSNVSVEAVIDGPDGKKHKVILHDEKENEPQSGEYEGLFIPKKTRRYQGTIHIHCRSGRAVLAQGMQRLLHDEKAEKLSLRSKAPNFVRVVPFTFEVGQRKTLKDSEKRDRLTDRYRRRRPAPRSAKS